MAKGVSAFGDFPGYFPNYEWLSKISSQMGALNIPSTNSYIQTITSFANSPILHDVNRFATLYNTPTNQAIQEIIGLIGKLNIPETPPPRRRDIPSLLFDYDQGALKYITEWSNPLYNIWNERPATNEVLLSDREEKLSHLTALAEEVSSSKNFQESPAPSEDDRQTAAEEVKAIFASGGNWEQRFMDSIQAFSKTHPVVAWILEKFFFVILIELIVSLSASGIGEILHPARLYEEPDTSSQVIREIEPNQSVIVVGDVPYYYAAQIKDPQTGEIISGYVSKRSVRLCESDSQEDSLP